MKKYFIIILLFIPASAMAQNTFNAIVRDAKTSKTLPHATVKIPDLKITSAADSTGSITINNIPNGKFEIEVSFIGYAGLEKTYTFPTAKPDTVFDIRLQTMGSELDEVVIQSTRTDQNLRDIPTRIEALPLEELDEKSSESPGDIKMLLSETTGILVQQTSAVSGSANFRIQGLDSRYTQLLQDGMPMYQGFSGSLSLLQISPLDLKQVEYMKGSESTLYGGGAIAGLINLISRTPTSQPQLTFLLNGTSAKGLDASGLWSQKWDHIGTTVLISYDHNGAYDPSGQGFSAIPKVNRVTINPKIFIYADDRNQGWFGVNLSNENRYGGDMQVLAGKADSVHQYFQRNITFRFSTQLSFTHKIDSASSLNFKNTFGYFNRDLTEPGFEFAGRQVSSYTEATYVNHRKRADWVTGVNLATTNFTNTIPVDKYNYDQFTAGVFGQNTFRASNWFSLESGLRMDYNTPAPANKADGIFILPRINALIKYNEHWTSRIGGGLGYKMPSLFNDASEEGGYENINPISIGNTKVEQSIGANGDINFRTSVGETFLNVNQLFFYTKVNDPIILVNNSFINASGYLASQGTETNVRLNIDELAFYLGYTYTDTKEHFNGRVTTQPLTPKNRFSFDSSYEIEDQFRVGLEAFYTGPQLLSDGTEGRSFITFGALVQKMWKHFDVFINAENLTDQRQTRWQSIYTGSISDPVFREIYAPLDGVVVNAGIRIKLLN
jgi:iron complex outermembrane receptor protein